MNIWPMKQSTRNLKPQFHLRKKDWKFLFEKDNFVRATEYTGRKKDTLGHQAITKKNKTKQKKQWIDLVLTFSGKMLSCFFFMAVPTKRREFYFRHGFQISKHCLSKIRWHWNCSRDKCLYRNSDILERNAVDNPEFQKTNCFRFGDVTAILTFLMSLYCWCIGAEPEFN